MKRTGWIRGAAVSLACLGTIVPQQALAATTVMPSQGQRQAQPAVTDVALQAGGTLRGQLVDAQGVAQANTQVAVLHDGKQVAQATTDSAGNFRVENLRGGVYQVAAGDSVSVYRLWTANSAPPAARDQALVVSQSELVRGQSRAMQFLTNPWVLAGLVGAAIAIPIAVSNSDRSSS